MAPGCYKMHPNGNCVTCESLRVTTSFRSLRRPRAGKYDIKKQLTCTSTYVIYIINCLKPGCTVQYVGSTVQELKERHYGHRRYISKGKARYGEHLKYHGKQYELIAIEQVADGNRIRTKKGFQNAELKLTDRKYYWIEKLDACSVNVRGCR